MHACEASTSCSMHNVQACTCQHKPHLSCPCLQCRCSHCSARPRAAGASLGQSGAAGVCTAQTEGTHRGMAVYPVYPSRKGCFSPYTGQEVQCIQGGKYRYIATPLLWLPWACPCKATCKAPRSTPLNLVGQNKSCTIAEHNSAAFKELYKMNPMFIVKDCL